MGDAARDVFAGGERPNRTAGRLLQMQCRAGAHCLQYALSPCDALARATMAAGHISRVIRLVNVHVEHFAILGPAVRVVCPDKAAEDFGADAGSAPDPSENSPLQWRERNLILL
jgi:hypothetical protein